MQDEILKNFDQHIFYHGTSYQNATGIIGRGYGEGVGLLGSGVYITCNWLIALWAMYWKYCDHGAILRVGISKGTRILNSAKKPDRKCLQYLRKEFGEEILKKHPRKVIPKNKRLTQKEFINLFRYHYWNFQEKEKDRFGGSSRFFWDYIPEGAGGEKRAKGTRFHKSLCFKLVSDLRIQYQFDGFGNPEDEFGVVIFEGNHLKVKEIIFEWIRGRDSSVPYDFCDDWLNPKSDIRKKFPDVDHLIKYFQKRGSKEAKELAKQVATAAKKKS